MSNQKTILLIDDEVSLQQLVKMTLKTKGYNVEIAGNGLEGLEKLKTLKPDLIILDMNMPKMGGVEFYQKICDKLNKPQYPVLVLTARANMEQLFKEFNIDGFMAKPMEIDDLLKEVDTIIKKSPVISKEIGGSATGVRKVCVIEDDAEILNQIGSTFLAEGYVVSSARNGTEGVEKIFNNIPDVALVKLGLADIAGDMVILKLKMMAKTQGVKYILYTQQIAEMSTIAQKIGDKEGIDRFVEFVGPQDLVEAVNEVLKG